MEQKKAGSEPNYLVKELIAVRKAKKITQRELASHAGMFQEEVSRIEKGGIVPRLDRFIRLADALDMQITLIPKTQCDGTDTIPEMELIVERALVDEGKELVKRVQAYLDRLQNRIN